MELYAVASGSESQPIGDTARVDDAACAAATGEQSNRVTRQVSESLANVAAWRVM